MFFPYLLHELPKVFFFFKKKKEKLLFLKDLRFVDLFGHCAILVITKFVQLSVIHPCSFKLVNQRYPLIALGTIIVQKRDFWRVWSICDKFYLIMITIITIIITTTRSKSKTHLMMAILVKPRSFPVLSEREANGQELARSSRGNKIHS